MISFANISINNAGGGGATLTITGVTNSSAAGFTSSGFFGFRATHPDMTPANFISGTYGGVPLGNAIGYANTSVPGQPSFAVAGTNLPLGSNTLILNFSSAAVTWIQLSAAFYTEAGAVTSSGNSNTNGASTTRTVDLNPTSTTDWYVVFLNEASGTTLLSVAPGGTVRNNVNVDTGDSTTVVGVTGTLTVTMTLSGSVSSAISGYTFAQGTALSGGGPRLMMGL